MRAKPILIGVLGLAVLVAAVLMVVQYNLQRTAEARVAGFADGLPPGVEMTYGAVSLGFLGRDLTVDDVRLALPEQPPVRIERVHLIEFDRAGRPPAHMHARLQGVEQDLAALGNEQVQLLTQLGYEQMRGDYEIDYRYHARERSLDLRRLSAHLDDIGSLSASLELDGVDLEQAATLSQQHWLESRLLGVRLRYDDDSLLPRVYREVAQQQQITETQVVDELLGRLDERFGGLQGPFFQELRQQLELFLRDPGSLTLSAEPAEPVPVLDAIAYALVRPADLPQLLNLRVQAAPER